MISDKDGGASADAESDYRTKVFMERTDAGFELEEGFSEP